MAKRHYRYNIYCFSLEKLLLNGRIIGNVLKLDREGTEFSFDEYKAPMEVKPDSFMFYQTRMIAKDLGIKAPKDVDTFSSASNLFLETFIDVNFENVVSSRNAFKALNKIEKIVLNFGKDDVTFVPFLKSNSMTKECKLYYVNEKYEEAISERVTFNLVKEGNNVQLSKWYAYSGLSLSQVTVLENINLNKEEIVVVDDYTVTRRIDAITAISVPLLIQDVRRFIELSKKTSDADNEERDTICERWNCYLNSEDFKQLDESLMNGADDMCKALSLIAGAIDGREGFDDEDIATSLKLLFLGDEEINKYAKDASSKARNVPWFKFRVKQFPHTINAFDGEGLISKEFADELNEELGLKDDKKSSSFQIRLPFLKGVVHACDLKQFFDDNGQKTILGIVNFTGGRETRYKEYNIENVKMVLTLSQVKFAAFADNFNCEFGESQWNCYLRHLKDYDYHIGINNLEPNQSKDALLNYEFLSTMPLGSGEYAHILEYGKKMLDDNLQDEAVADYLDDDIRALYDANPELFKTTNHFKSARKDIYGSSMKDALLMRFPVESRRKFLSGDLFVLLCSLIGRKTRKEERLALNECYIPNDKIASKRKRIAVLRNPHYSRNEIALLKPAATNDVRKAYFSMQTGCIWVNPMSCVAERLGGADMDGDTVVALYDQKLVNKLQKTLIQDSEDGTSHMIYPVVLIPSMKGGPKTNDHFNRMTCLRNTFSSRVGIISNDAVKFAEYAYETKDLRLHDYVGFYCILGGLEIDAAKTGSRPEFPKINDLLGRNVTDELKTRSATLFIKLKDLIDKDHYFKSTIAGSKFDDEEEEDTKFDGEVKEFLSSSNQTCFNDMVKETMHWKMPKQEKTDATWPFADGDKESAIKFFEAALVHKTITRLLSGRTKYLARYNMRKSLLKSLIRGSGTRDPMISPYGYTDSDMNTFFNGYSSNETPENLIKSYCNLDQKYHYLTDDSEKDKAIEKLGLECTSSSSSYYKDFENGGFKNLFISILYNKYREVFDGIVSFQPYSCETKDELFKKYSLSWLNKGFIDMLSLDELKDALERANKRIQEVDDEIQGGHKNVSYMRKTLDSTISNEYGSFSMSTINMVLDAENNALVARVYNSSYKQFLENAKKGGK